MHFSFPGAAEGGHAHLQNTGRRAAGLCGIRAAGRAQPLLRLHRRGVRPGQLLARGRAPRRQPLSGHAAGRAGGDPVLLAVRKPPLRPAGAPLPGPGPLLRHLHQSPVRRAQCHPARRRGVLCGDVHRHKGQIRLLYHRAHPWYRRRGVGRPGHQPSVPRPPRRPGHGGCRGHAGGCVLPCPARTVPSSPPPWCTLW